MDRKELEKKSGDELLILLKTRKNDSSRHKVMQMGLKVTLSSACGILGNEYSRYYDIRIAEAITMSGQLSIQWIRRKLNDFLNKKLGTGDVDFMVAGDTDSLYLTLSRVVEKYCVGKSTDEIIDYLDKISDRIIQPVIGVAYEQLKNYTNAFQQKMKMSREIIADVGVWRAKKNYALNVYDLEGVRYDEPKLKIMGMESARSSTPEVCRVALNEAIRRIMQVGELSVQTYIAEFKREFMNKTIEDISFPRGVNDIAKWVQPIGFKSGTPIHVKGSISYNRLLASSGVQKQYRKINSGDKIKFIYLKKANPTNNNTIAYPDVLPPEFALEEYVDYNLQFQKTFLGPIKSVLDVVGWTVKKQNTLDDFF